MSFREKTTKTCELCQFKTSGTEELVIYREIAIWWRNGYRRKLYGGRLVTEGSDMMQECLLEGAKYMVQEWLLEGVYGVGLVIIWSYMVQDWILEGAIWYWTGY